MSTRRLRSSSLRLHVPWEVLLGVCQQSDESTLRNLCLVSYGMLELAGPVLYEDVDIKTLERLYLFFIPPSLIPSSSRLRPHLGLHRLRRLFENFEESPSTETVASFFPPPTWTLPHTRLSSSSPLDLIVYSLQLSANGDEGPEILSLFKHHIIPFFHVRHSFDFLSLAEPNTPDPSRAIDVKFRETHGSPITTRTSGMYSIDLNRARRFVSMLAEGREEDKTPSVVATLDLRRLVLLSTEDAGHVKDTMEGFLDEEGKWLNCEEVLVEIMVASEEVKKVVDGVVREWEKEERRSQCRVVWSS